MSALDDLLLAGTAGASAWKLAARLAATTNQTLSGLPTIDSVATAAGDRVLLTGQTDAKKNGVWVVAATAWARAPDLFESKHAKLGLVVRVISGTVHAGSLWALTSPATGEIRIDIDTLTFSKFAFLTEDQATALAGATPDADPDTLFLRDEFGDGAVRNLEAVELFAVSLTSSEGLTLSSDGVEPVAIVGGAGGIGLQGDFVSVVRAGAQATLNMTGTTSLIFSTAGDLALACTTGDAIDCQVNAVSCLRVTASSVSVATNLLAFPAAATIRNATNGAGAGFALTVGGGLGTGAASGATTLGTDGATPGTNPGGGVISQTGTRVSNASVGHSFREGSNQYCLVNAHDSAYAGMRFGANAIGSGTTGALNGRIEGAALVLVGLSGGLYLQGPGVSGIDLTSDFVEFAGQRCSAIDSQAFAASTTVNCHNGNNHAIGAMTANMTALTLSNPRPGSEHRIEFLQDGTGGWTVTPNANFIASGLYALTVDGTANFRTIWTVYVVSASVWRLENRQVFAT